MSLRLIYNTPGKRKINHPYIFSRASLDYMKEWASGRVKACVWEEAHIETVVFGDMVWHSLFGDEWIQEREPTGVTWDHDNRIWTGLDGYHFPPDLLPY